MTQAIPNAAPSSVPAEPESLAPTSESFWSLLLRRTRYVIAIAVAALLFCTLGWSVAAPPGQEGGVSLMAWPNHGLVMGLSLAVIVIVSTIVCTLLVHPDSPHMGLFCTLLGMAGLSIRGGTIHMLVQYAQITGTYAHIAQLLAVECAQWAILLLIAEAFTRVLHNQFFANTHWIVRARPDAGHAILAQSRLRHAVGVSQTVSQTLKTDKIQGWPVIPLAVIWSMAIATILLYVLMQSQAKGQVLMASFIAFLVSTLCAYLAFPRVPIVALLLAVPLTAGLLYLYGMHMPTLYPGHAAFFAARALPIDYVSAGGAAAILGYYWALQWSLHSSLDEEG